MNDRESLYFDTISLAGSETAAAVHRKSMSQSRNTIYHSAVDITGDETPAKRGYRTDTKSNKPTWTPDYRHSSALDQFNGKNNMSDSTNFAIASQIIAQRNERSTVGSTSHLMTHDEHFKRLLQSNTCRRFKDGFRTVDFVLAYNGDDHKLDNLKKREIFEANLEKEGIHLELDDAQHIHFIKLHAPLEVLCKYAEILKIKFPMKKIHGQDAIHTVKSVSSFKSYFGRLFRPVLLNPEKFPPRPEVIHCEFSRIYKHLFNLDHPNFFEAGIRSLIINFILERQHFIAGEETPDNLGIEKLLEDGVYDSAYTLHDDYDRDLLLSEWANLRMWKSLQPLDNIKEYFGPKVALYFAWLGFYTQMLIPVSIVGILCFIYGFITWNSDPISQEICNDNKTFMCPQCDRSCDFWQLRETCNSAKMNYLIDNNVTILFASIMSIWSVLYLELWKRYAAGLVHRWGLTGFSQHVEHPRPQYLAKIRNSKKLSVPLSGFNNVLEPDVPFWKTKFLSNFTSYSIMLLSISVALIAIFSIIIYRMAQKASHSILGNEDSMTFKIMVLPMTAGLIDLIVISLLDYAYSYLAVHLTNLEYCRTRTEYDESLTIKNYIFQFVNYYSSLFYIAFLKGKFVGYPKKYNLIFGFRQEECNPGGCLMELCMQLIIIMVGKQAVNAIVEMFIPYLMHSFRKYGSPNRKSEKRLVVCNQWTEDYHLAPWTNTSMFSEYLEMVLQFGFIILFGLAFPLAPFLALLNNVIEVRLDAIKMLRLSRRPVAQRARDIGVWFSIMTIIAKIAVASSAMIIAFSTNFIPKLIYKSTTKDESLEGYLNFTLAYFNTKDFQVRPAVAGSQYQNVTSCRYTEFRNAPWDKDPYKRPILYWKILTARLAFIVIFQNIIGMLQAVVAWAIPDVPGRLLKRIKREGFLLREYLIEFEKKTAAEKAALQPACNADQSENDITMTNNDAIATNRILNAGTQADLFHKQYAVDTENNDRTTPV